MANRDQLRSHCRVCDRPRRKGERFSARGKCPDCGEGRMLANVRDLKGHAGPLFDHWRHRCAAAFGVDTPATVEPAEEEPDGDGRRSRAA